MVARRSDHPHRARPGAPARRPVGGHRHRAPVARAPAGPGRARQGGRPARRTVAAAVPQDARRATPRGPEPGEEGLTGGADSTPSAGSPSCSSAAVPTPTRSAPSAMRPAPSPTSPPTTLGGAGPGRGCRASPASESPRPRSSPRPSTARCPTTWPSSRRRPTTRARRGGPAAPRLAPRGLPLPLRLVRRGQPHPRDGRGGRRARPRVPGALTDHSPRLTVAHGLNAERLRAQLDVLAS